MAVTPATLRTSVLVLPRPARILHSLMVRLAQRAVCQVNARRDLALHSNAQAERAALLKTHSLALVQRAECRTESAMLQIHALALLRLALISRKLMVHYALAVLALAALALRINARRVPSAAIRLLRLQHSVLRDIRAVLRLALAI